jgi:hypothetical protein
LIIQPKYFWNYVSKFRKDNDSRAQFQVDCLHSPAPCEIASVFSRHFQSVYSNNPGVLWFPFTLYSDILIVASINDDVSKAVVQLQLTKSVELDGIPSSSVKGCVQICMP